VGVGGMVVVNGWDFDLIEDVMLGEKRGK